MPENGIPNGVVHTYQRDEQAEYNRVAREIERRDGNAEWREWRAYRLAGGLILALIIAVVGAVIFALRSQDVEVVVQVVQHDEQGRMVKIGVPMDLLDYKPQDGAWRDMLTAWVNKRHWRGEEESGVRARADWRWLYLHACGQARKQLEEAEKVEKPFEPSPKRVSVTVDSITKDVGPHRFHVFWTSITTDTYNPKKDIQKWTSTFTVGRVAPKTASDATLNNLGLCVTAFDDEKRDL